MRTLRQHPEVVHDISRDVDTEVGVIALTVRRIDTILTVRAVEGSRHHDNHRPDLAVVDRRVHEVWNVQRVHPSRRIPGIAVQ